MKNKPNIITLIAVTIFGLWFIFFMVNEIGEFGLKWPLIISLIVVLIIDLVLFIIRKKGKHEKNN